MVGCLTGAGSLMLMSRLTVGYFVSAGFLTGAGFLIAPGGRMFGLVGWKFFRLAVRSRCWRLACL